MWKFVVMKLTYENHTFHHRIIVQVFNYTHIVISVVILLKFEFKFFVEKFRSVLLSE